MLEHGGLDCRQQLGHAAAFPKQYASGGGRTGISDEIAQHVNVSESALVGIAEFTVEHEHCHDGMLTATGLVRDVPVDSGSGNRMAGGATQGIRGPGVVTVGDIGWNEVEVMLAALQVMGCRCDGNSPSCGWIES